MLELNAPSGPAVTRTVTVAVFRAASSPPVEDAELRRGAACGRCLYAELLPEGTAQTRAARVHPLLSSPHPHQGAFVYLLCSVSSECLVFQIGGAQASAERGVVCTAVLLTRGFAPSSAVSGSSGTTVHLPAPGSLGDVSQNNISGVEILCLPQANTHCTLTADPSLL